MSSSMLQGIVGFHQGALVWVLWGILLLTEAAAAAEYGQNTYAKLLEQFVDEAGMVDYAALKQNPQDLEQFLLTIAQVEPQEFDQWTEAEQIAFWCNAYNACTLKAIIDNFPIKSSFLTSLRFPKNSIRQIDGVWDELEFTIMGRPMTLNQTEHDTLRVDYDEPRIHFALNCASIGCPKLRREPYIGALLDEQLDDQIVSFINDADKFRITRKGIYISQLLKWYGKDFISQYGTNERFTYLNETERAVLNFFYPYLKEDLQDLLNESELDVKYLDYDWSLNEQSRIE